MAKLKLLANPTFKALVAIPVAGEDAVAVEFTFRHRTKTQLEEFQKKCVDQTQEENFMQMVCAWELDEPFDEASVKTFLENYMGSALATYHVYLDQLIKGKSKN